MQDILNTTEVSLWSLKFVGVFFVSFAGIYLLLNFRSNTKTPPSWKKLLLLSLGTAFLNAGLMIIFGKNTFIVTPVFIITILISWFFNKMTLWNKKHIVGFLSLFTIFSMSIFIMMTATFFHLAVEGKI